MASTQILPSRWLVVLLGLLTAVGPVSTDIYLPAFPALERSLHAQTGSAGMTLAIWFLGLASGQLVMGPLSDRLGRRKPLLLGSIIFTIGSVACALAPSMPVFLGARLTAALGASALLVVPSAVVRDTAQGHQAVRMLSRLVLIMGVVPVIAPAIGGVVLSWISWRTIFWFSAGYGFVVYGLVYWTLPETHQPAYRASLAPIAMGVRILYLARDRTFSTHAGLCAFGAFVSFAYLSASPTVFLRGFHLTPTLFGGVFGLNAVCMIGAVQANEWLMRRYGGSFVLTRAIQVALIMEVGMIGLTLMVWRGCVYPGPVCAVLFGGLMTSALSAIALTGPNATVGALTPHPSIAGTASALLGTLQYLMGALAGVAVEELPGTIFGPMVWTMGVGMIGMYAVDGYRRRNKATAQRGRKKKFIDRRWSLTQ